MTFFIKICEEQAIRSLIGIFHWEKIEKDFNDFWHRKLTLKVKFWHFLTPPPLTQFTKFNNFLWVCWFLGKNLSNFVPLVWKLYNLYCHNERRPQNFAKFSPYLLWPSQSIWTLIAQAPDFPTNKIIFFYEKNTIYLTIFYRQLKSPR